MTLPFWTKFSCSHHWNPMLKQFVELFELMSSAVEIEQNKALRLIKDKFAKIVSNLQNRVEW